MWTQQHLCCIKSSEKRHCVPTCRRNTASIVILLTCVITNVHGTFLFLPGAYIVILIKRLKVRNFSTSALNFNMCLLLIGVKNRSHYAHLTQGEIEFCQLSTANMDWTLMDPVCCHDATKSVLECCAVFYHWKPMTIQSGLNRGRKSCVKEPCVALETGK